MNTTIVPATARPRASQRRLRGAGGEAATAAAKAVHTARKPPVWLGCSPAAPHENEVMDGMAA